MIFILVLIIALGARIIFLKRTVKKLDRDAVIETSAGAGVNIKKNLGVEDAPPLDSSAAPVIPPAYPSY